MYAMVDKFSNVYSNLNQFYMAGVMTAPMVLIELAVMGAMYKDKKLNAIIAVVSVIALIAFFAMIRLQTFVGDKELLKSMIPHHAGAVLMCERASVQDPEIKKLCQRSRRAARTSQANARTAHEARRRQTPRRRASVCRS